MFDDYFQEEYNIAEEFLNVLIDVGVMATETTHDVRHKVTDDIILV